MLRKEKNLIKTETLPFLFLLYRHYLGKDQMTKVKNFSTTSENRGCGNGLCIMVAHAVYVCVSLPAGSAEMTLASIAAIAGHIAGSAAAEGAAGSSGLTDAVGVAEATANSVVVAITRRGTVAVVY